MTPEKSEPSPVRIIGSRELHQNLPGILRELERPDTRYVLTVHGKPRAVLIGAAPFLRLIHGNRQTSSSEAMVGLQLSALLGNDLHVLPLDELEQALEPKANDEI
jgi:prevent-host-death family protein